jgi:hypothetical protein
MAGQAGQGGSGAQGGNAGSGGAPGGSGGQGGALGGAGGAEGGSGGNGAGGSDCYDAGITPFMMDQLDYTCGLWDPIHELCGPGVPVSAYLCGMPPQDQVGPPDCLYIAHLHTKPDSPLEPVWCCCD